MRDSPSLAFLPALREAGATIRAFDPEGTAEAEKLMPELDYCTDPYEAIEGADALILITEWNEFRALDLGRVKRLMRRPVIIDLRNIYNPEEMIAAGLVYHSIGRPGSPATAAAAEPGLRAVADGRDRGQYGRHADPRLLLCRRSDRGLPADDGCARHGDR